MSCKGSILDVVDIVLSEVEVGQVSETVHGAKEHGLQFVLIQSQVMDRVVDVLGDGFIWWLVLAADSQPHISFVPFNEPTVPVHHVRHGGKKEQDGRENQENRGGRSTLHVASEKKVAKKKKTGSCNYKEK